jgi:hypothetical protein
MRTRLDFSNKMIRLLSCREDWACVLGSIPLDLQEVPWIRVGDVDLVEEAAVVAVVVVVAVAEFLPEEVEIPILITNDHPMTTLRNL